MEVTRSRGTYQTLAFVLLVAGGSVFVFIKYLVGNESLALMLLFTMPLIWAVLSQAPRRIEYTLLAYALFYSFFYRALKPTIFSSFLWVIIVPATAIAYLFFSKEGAHRLVLRNRLDYLMLAYMVYGTVMTVIGAAFGVDPPNTMQTFVHAYLPSVLYFISRMYNAGSERRVKGTLNLAWIICLIIIIDGAAEYYILEVIKDYRLIPWTAKNVEEVLAGMPANMLARNPMIPFRNISILASEKVLSMVVSVFCCLTAGFLLPSQERTAVARERSLFQRSTVINLAFFVSLLALSVFLASYASTVALFVVVFLLVTMIKTGKARVFAMFAVFLAACAFFLHEYFIALYIYKFTAGAVADGRSAAEHTFSIGSVFAEYASSPFSILLGTGITKAGSIRGGSGTELRLLVYPLYYGIAWGFIVCGIAWNIYKYCRFLILFRDGRDPVNSIGLACMGFFLIYFTDVHYPAFDRHGPYEMFFIMAGMLSSLRETVAERDALPADPAVQGART